ncbi:MAG: DUF1853 family protein, partial [Flavobacteriaceae bacterium]|nr:DUF1853 family protein [Flavobacteriaceae bacterium]
MNKLNRQFIGFISTPELWDGSHSLGLTQFQLPTESFSFTGAISENLMLGKRMEHFFEFQINSLPSTEIICQNIQIYRNKITLGELDFIIQTASETIHIELVYKFYLYIPSENMIEIEKWIGPNKKDSFIEKLTKLQEKQLPLLFKEETNPLLEYYRIKQETIKQRVCFKAQLFLPLHEMDSIPPEVNPKCI